MARRIRYDRLPTEQRHPGSVDLDRLSLLQLFRLMNAEDSRVIRAVASQLPAIARATRLITLALRRGGRLFFVGAGTSGRLGVLEAAECPPTFHTPPSLIQAIMAGGPDAVFASREGAEDHAASARTFVRKAVRSGDVVVGIAASGVTPFVEEALRSAASLGASTILITCHPRARIPARVRITPEVGPELLTGSTRLKAGTAAKLVLNMLTLGVMVRSGKTYGNLMVDVRPTSRKLTERALSIIQTLTNSSRPQAEQALDAAEGHVKAAVLVVTHRLTYADAQRRLSRCGGSLRDALRTARRT